jgi:hypothetical protein
MDSRHQNNIDPPRQLHGVGSGYSAAARPKKAYRVSTMRWSDSRFWSGWILPGAVLVFCLACCAFLIVQQARGFFAPSEVGYGDFYVLHTIRQFQQTGVIYQDLAREVPSVYGPLLYSVLAIPGRFITAGNPLLGPRLIVMAAFLLSVGAAVSIARKLLPHRRVWLWSIPLSLSFTTMSAWVLQIRGDFLAISFSLLAVRLLLSRWGWRAALLAGLCAGLAPQFKFTYVAALASGLLWLAVRRRWKSLAAFAVGGGVTCIGIYVFFLLREPWMLDNLLALRKPIVDFAGLMKVAHDFSIEPVALLGLSALPFLPWRLRGRWTLLTSFTAISLSIALITDLQAGGNINYFFEAMFGLVPLAAFAVLQLRRSNFSVAGLFLLSVLTLTTSVPLGTAAIRATRALPAAMAEQHRAARVFRAAFQGQKVLSFVPAVTIFAPEVALSEPFLASFLERLGEFDFHPLAGRIRSQAFDLIVTSIAPMSYRGVYLLSPTLRPAIREAYEPFCQMEGLVIFVRRNSAGPLTERLVQLGCEATDGFPR